jgi:hypothetical protein
MIVNYRALIPAIATMLLLTHAIPAWAYIDPNAGGVLFQLLAPLFAAAVGGWLFLRRWIAEQVRRLWRRLTRRAPE